jgi:hypothetical protein
LDVNKQSGEDPLISAACIIKTSTIENSRNDDPGKAAS